MNYEAHEYANIFPMIGDEEFTKLKEDIKQNGVLQPVVLYEGKILDGRNRHKACSELGIEPKYEQYSGEQPLQWVISLNLHRRHLESSQRATIAVESEVLVAKLQSEAKSRQLRTEENRNLVSQKVDEQDYNEKRTDQLLAQTFHTNRQYINDAKKLKESQPELFNKVKLGETTLSEVKRDLKRAERENKLEQQRKEIKEGNVAAPSGKYDIIAIDPPWEAGVKYDPNHFMGRNANPYPEMTIEQIKDIKLPAKDDCVLFLWITNSKVPYIKEILESWGFQYKNIVTWDKINMGVGKWMRNITEHCVVAFKGKPYFENTKWTTLLHEKKTTHSTKPEIFYQMVDEICVGRKLEYFSRTQRAGWDVYGDEVNEIKGDS